MQVAEVGYIIDFLQLLSLRIYSIYFTYKDSTNEYKNPPLFSGKKNHQTKPKRYTTLFL